MRFTNLLISTVATLGLASTAFAQVPAGVYAWPNTGCVDGGGTAPALVGVGGTGGSPVIPTGGVDLTWAIKAPCGAGSAAAFYVWSSCPTSGAPTFNWPTTDPFFAGWTSPPAFCGGSILATQIFLFDGALADAAGDVVFPFPLIDMRGFSTPIDLVSISQAAPNFCLQFVCVDAAFQLTSVTQGALFAFQYSGG